MAYPYEISFCQYFDPEVGDADYTQMWPEVETLMELMIE